MSLPLSFIPNPDQTDPAVQFQVKGAGYTAYFTSNEVVLNVARPAGGESVAWSAVRIRFDGANPNPQVEGLGKLPGVANFFIGNDPARWRTNVPTFSGVVYRNLYPGIDLTYRGEDGRLKSTFVAAPAANARQVRLAYSGVDLLQLREDGALVLQTDLGDLIEERPVIFQEVDGRRVEVEGGYRLLGDTEVGFDVGAHDAARPLVIDPTLSYSTYLGGSGFDRGLSIAVDAAGNVYVTGSTLSSDFPTTTGAYTTTLGGIFDAFVTKVNAGGTALSYSTYLGGSSLDFGNGIAVDSAGNVYLTGQTSSTDFPIASAIQGSIGGGSDAFALKLVATGTALIYSTYLGGSGTDAGAAIAVDSAGSAYVTGSTGSIDFPTASPIQGSNAGGTDAFVTKVNAGGTTWSYSTYLGGGGTDTGRGIAVDGSGNAYVVGQTGSSDFAAVSAIQGSNAGGSDAFVTKVDAGGAAWSYSTYLGGGGNDDGGAIAVDSTGAAYVTGSTLSNDFPTPTGVYTTANGADDAFVTKVDVGGTAWSYSTYLGGSGTDIGHGIAVGDGGEAFVTGETGSTDFPTVSPHQGANGGGSRDAFVVEVNAGGAALSYSTYLGGDQGDFGNGIAVNSAGGLLAAYVVGETDGNFPLLNALQPTSGGSRDAFVAKFSDPCTLQGNVDSDLDVDVQDVQLIAAAWRSNPPDLAYDVDTDNDVDIVDIMSAASNLGDACP